MSSWFEILTSQKVQSKHAWHVAMLLVTLLIDGGTYSGLVAKGLQSNIGSQSGFRD